MTRKGIILAGGSGTRLHPLTIAVSKQIMPVYDKPMIYYPLHTLMLAGIRDILVITTPRDNQDFINLLGDGSQWGINIQYAIQEKPNGLAEAFIIGEEFLNGDPCALILGDNLFYGAGFESVLRKASKRKESTIFGYRIDDPHRYGVVEIDEKGNAVSIEEKPEHPKSNYAVPGLYFYDKHATEIAKTIKPSARGELEITSMNEVYMKQGNLKVEKLFRGMAWFDTGTHDALIETASFVQTIEKRQGTLIGSPEITAFEKGWIDKDQLYKLGKELKKTEYGKELMEIAKEDD